MSQNNRKPFDILRGWFGAKQASHNDLSDQLNSLEKQFKRTAKEVYKANVLTEDAVQSNQETLKTLQAQLETEQTEQVKASRLQLAEALLPVIDAIEAGLKTGEAQIDSLEETAPLAARTLAGWLDGQRLLQERVLRLLNAEGIYKIAAIGQSFDPYQHVAVKTTQQPDQPPNTIVAIERDGYRYRQKVLRFAEVVVNQEGTQHEELSNTDYIQTGEQ